MTRCCELTRECCKSCEGYEWVSDKIAYLAGYPHPSGQIPHERRPGKIFYTLLHIRPPWYPPALLAHLKRTSYHE
jgi:hypothetical protein